MPENQPEDQSTKRPELPLTLLEMAFSYAALNEQETLSKQDIIQAIRHSNRLRKEIRTAHKPSNRFVILSALQKLKKYSIVT
ncbi:MAG: hypothetical protein ACLRYY_05300 [Anaerobutyricum soehngenii]